MPTPPAPAKTRRLRRVLARLAIYVLIALSMWWGTLYFAQDFLMFPSHYSGRTGPAIPPAGTVVLHHAIPDGNVEAWYIPAPGAAPDRPAPLVVYFHGNGEIIDQMGPLVSDYHSLGCSLLMVEYRGFGRSDGFPSQEGITQDTLAVLEEVLKRPEVDAKKLVYHGRSLGGGAACDLTTHHKPAALILESTFYNAAAMAHTYFAPGFLLKNPYRNDRVVKTFDGQLLIVHGTTDRTIPTKHATWLAAENPGARLVLYPMDHNAMSTHVIQEFWKEIRKTLETAGIL